MKKALLTKLLVLTAAFMWAQEIKWYAKVPKEVYADGIFEIHFVLENAEGKNVKFPSFDGLEIISGPSVSDQFYAINGRATSSITYSFEAVASSSGTLQLEAATIEVKGKRYATKAATFVVKTPKKQSKPTKGEVAFVDLQISKESIYKGQQLVGEYQLYYNGNLGFEDAIQHPPFNDFTVTQLDVRNETLPGMAKGNMNYQGILADALAFFPKKQGRLSIGKSYFPLKERISNDDPWSYPFGKYRSFTLNSPEKYIEVKDLPAPIPEHFNGVVGQYEGSAILAEKKVAANQTLLVRVELNGNGDPSTMSPPRLLVPPQLEAYPAKLIKEEQYTHDRQLKHSHSWEIPVTAKESGQFEIKVDFQYFDPEAANYKTVDFPTLDAEVTKVSQAAIKSKDPEAEASAWLYYLIGLGVICISFLAWFYLRKQDVQNQPFEALEKSGQESELPLAKPQPFQERLSFINAMWEKGETNVFYTSLSLLLQETLFEKLGLPIEEQDKKTVLNHLRKMSTSSETLDLYLDVRSCIERALYAGGQNQDGPELLAKTKQFLESLFSLTKDTQTI
ncbi:MAG: BatD family protein [Saprospiraceae bacterium]|nr:BatD family protein [Saprospiraceae bacterium]